MAYLNKSIKEYKAGEDIFIGDIVSIKNSNQAFRLRETIHSTDVQMITGGSRYGQILWLEDDVFVVFCVIVGIARAVVIRVNKTNNKWGNFLSMYDVIASNSFTLTQAIKVDTSKFIIVYSDNGNSNYGKAMLFSYKNDTNNLVPIGATLVFKIASISSILNIKKLNDTDFIILYYYTGILASKVVRISGAGFVEISSECVISSTTMSSANIAVISPTKVLVTYGDATRSNGYAQILTVSNITINLGSEFTYHSGKSTVYNAVDIIDSTKAILVYSITSSSPYITNAIYLNLDTGTNTVTIGSDVIKLDFYYSSFNNIIVKNDIAFCLRSFSGSMEGIIFDLTQANPTIISRNIVGKYSNSGTNPSFGLNLQLAPLTYDENSNTFVTNYLMDSESYVGFLELSNEQMNNILTGKALNDAVAGESCFVII